MRTTMEILNMAKMRSAARRVRAHTATTRTATNESNGVILARALRRYKGEGLLSRLQPNGWDEV